MAGQPGVHQYTHIWAFAPPNNPNDNNYFTGSVMSEASVDGVSIIEGWSMIETSPPTSVPCVTSDTCQPDPTISGMYHTYNWATYDDTSSTSPVYQWLQFSPKKVNILVAPQLVGATNTATPHYVTSPAWYNLFYPRPEQDVINQVKDCSSLINFTGTAAVASYSSGQVTVTLTGCCSPPPTTSQSNLIQDQDIVWVAVTSPSACGNLAGTLASVASGSTSQFTYTPSNPSSCTNPIGGPTYISAAQSWAVPYEYPYKSALKAFWAAVVAHYGSNFALPSGGGGTNYFSQLNYFRFGGSVGTEWYPYCVSGTNGGTSVGLKTLSSPYTYVKGPGGTDMNHVGWLDFYQEMGNYLQSLAPPWRIIHSINAAENPVDYTYGDTEASYAVTWSNRLGIRDGFGSQGLSAQDYVNCTTPNNCIPPTSTYSASNWYPTFLQYDQNGVPLELQSSGLSYPGDFSCSHCGGGGSGVTFAGDLPTFLDFAITAGTTEVELYWRDLELAYDVNDYCSLTGASCTGICTAPPSGSCTSGSITVDNQLSVAQQCQFFQCAGQGNTTPYCSGNMPQTGANGNCAYATDINNDHGAH